MISKILLGSKGPLVSKICFGTLTMSNSQASLTPKQGGKLLSYAYSKGINFWDTAEIYNTYSHIKEGIKMIGKLPIVSTKSYAWDEASAKLSFEKARKETGLEYIDIFMLHEATNVLTMLGHSDALKYYIKMRDKGLIGCVGVSTHAIEPVQALALARSAINEEEVFPRVKEFDLGLFRELDIVHPIININGLGILDGNLSAMEYAIKAAHSSGIGIFGMKLFGGGNLLNNFQDAAEYGLNLDFVHSFAVGMQSENEIDTNIDLFSGAKISKEKIRNIKNKKRKLIIEDWCTGCGSCVKRCKTGALTLKEGKAVVDSNKCLLCSYCAYDCPQFAIKVV